VKPIDASSLLEPLQPGNELALPAGHYVVPAGIRRGGGPGAPIVITARDVTAPPRLVAPVDGGNILDIWAGHVTLRGLFFGPSERDRHAITIRGVDGVTVEDCVFEDVGGLALVATMTARAIIIRRNRLRRCKATAMYFGCHDGSCSILDLLIEDNTIDGVDAPGRLIGYGIQIKLNSAATIRRNQISDTKGPCIMVYGAMDRERVSRVEDNVVRGSRRSSGIVIGGGPAIVRGNVAIGHAQAGIAIENYGDRGLLRDIDVSGNTLQGNRRRGVWHPGVATGVRVGLNTDSA
jgi:Right handed beta helix region